MTASMHCYKTVRALNANNYNNMYSVIEALENMAAAILCTGITGIYGVCEHSCYLLGVCYTHYIINGCNNRSAVTIFVFLNKHVVDTKL